MESLNFNKKAGGFEMVFPSSVSLLFMDDHNNKHPNWEWHHNSTSSLSHITSLYTAHITSS